MLNPFEAIEDIRVNTFTEAEAKNFHTQVTRKSMMDPVKPIVIYIDSYGGSADALASMIATLEQVPNKIITVAVGKAMSSGTILLAAGDYRFCDRNARIMVHEIQGMAGGDVHKIKGGAKEVDRLNKYWIGHLAKNCGLSGYEELRALIKAIDGEELWLTPKQAKDLGIIDAIGLPSIQPLMLFDIGSVTYPRNPETGSVSMEDILQQVAQQQEEEVASITKKKVPKKKVAKKKIVKKKISKKKKVKSVAKQGPTEIDPIKAIKATLPNIFEEIIKKQGAQNVR